MVRMTDLLKKAKKLGAKKELPPLEKKRSPLSEEKPHIPKEEPIKPTVPGGEPVEFSKLLLEKAKESPAEKEDVTHKFMKASIPDEKETKELYFEVIEFVKSMFNTYKNDGNINRDDMMNTGHKIVNNVIAGPREILKLFHELDSPELYREYNALNVSILSVEIGIAYKYNKSILLDLAIVGLLHDMDLIKSKKIIDKPEKLHEKELEAIKKHSLNLATFTDNAFNFKEERIKAILQHHERRGGGGYPAGLTDRDIHNLAKIVGIADTYEAMTHSRPYKEKMLPCKAVLNIISNGKKLFSNETIKALVHCVGLYPVGSWVELNNGEIGKVLIVNQDLPLRPVVSILMDKDRNKLREVRTVDLQKIPSLYIKGVSKR